MVRSDYVRTFESQDYNTYCKFISNSDRFFPFRKFAVSSEPFLILFQHSLFFLLVMTGSNTNLPLLLPLLPPAPPGDSLHPVPVTHPHAGRPLLGRMFRVDRLGTSPQLHDVAEADTGSGFGVVVVLEDG